MQWLERWWVVLVVTAAIVAGIATAITIEDEKNKIAAYAAVVGTVSILLAAEKHWRDKKKEDREHNQKEEEKRELLKATPEFGTYIYLHNLCLGVELYNSGKVMVPIKKVSLIETRGDSEKAFPMVLYEAGKHEAKARIELEPKHHARFYAMAMDHSIAELKAFDPSRVRISVESFSGEVARVEGRAVIDAITAEVLKLEVSLSQARVQSGMPPRNFGK